MQQYSTFVFDVSECIPTSYSINFYFFAVTSNPNTFSYKNYLRSNDYVIKLRLKQVNKDQVQLCLLKKVITIQFFKKLYNNSKV